MISKDYIIKHHKALAENVGYAGHNAFLRYKGVVYVVEYVDHSDRSRHVDKLETTFTVRQAVQSELDYIAKHA